MEKKKSEKPIDPGYFCLQCKEYIAPGILAIDGMEYTDGSNQTLSMFCSVECLKKKRKKHKFNAKKAEADGIIFSSKAERSYYNKLNTLKQLGEVVFFLRQVPIHLSGNTKYVVDFQVFYADGTVAFIDVKGMSTPMFKMKKKQVEDLYPILIEVVK